MALARQNNAIPYASSLSFSHTLNLQMLSHLKRKHKDFCYSFVDPSKKAEQSGNSTEKKIQRPPSIKISGSSEDDSKDKKSPTDKEKVQR